MTHTPRIAVLLVAAGTGSRFGAPSPKQFSPIAGRMVIRHAAEALAQAGLTIQPVGDAAAIDPALAGMDHLPTVAGGATRQDSVRAGLEALADFAPDIVMVHDAARPFIPAGTIEALLAALETHPGAIPAVPVADTLKRGEAGSIVATVSRDGLFRAQTPQAFAYTLLRDLHRSAAPGATDDAAILEAAGHKVALVPGHDDNIKLTYPEDLVRLERILTPALDPRTGTGVIEPRTGTGAIEPRTGTGAMEPRTGTGAMEPRTGTGAMEPRTGTGYDVHVLVEDRKLILCGIDVPHERGLSGHSDADVGIHALCDAIYGALAEGDIGRHFPPSENQWKDADSARFLAHAAGRVTARGGRITNVDVTLVCERPKITPHAPAMIARLAGIMGIDPARVSVKATTSERLGFTGRMEGIAAQAVATILLPA